MSEIIKGSMDVLKITKSKLYAGTKGTYLNFTLVPTPNSEYGDYMVVEDVSKEEREAGQKGVILGNAKIWKKQEPQQAPQQDSKEPTDLPF